MKKCLKDLDVPFLGTRVVVTDVASTKLSDFIKVFLFQHKVLEVVNNTRGSDTLGYHRYTTLSSKSNAYLCRWLVELLGDIDNLYISYNEMSIIVIPFSSKTYHWIINDALLAIDIVAQRRVGGDMNVLLGTEFEKLRLEKTRMQFHLIDSRTNTTILENVFNSGDIKVGDTYWETSRGSVFPVLRFTHTHNPNILMLLTNVFDETFIDKLFHSLPSGSKVNFFNGYLAIPFLEKCQCIHFSSLIRVFMCMQYTYFLGKRYSWVGTLGVSSGLPSGYIMITMDEHWVERKDQCQYVRQSTRANESSTSLLCMLWVSHLIKNAFSVLSYPSRRHREQQGKLCTQPWHIQGDDGCSTTMKQ